MAKEMQRDLLERMHRTKMQLKELDARIARLRNRMAAGDPDITRAALDRAEIQTSGTC